MSSKKSISKLSFELKEIENHFSSNAVILNMKVLSDFVLKNIHNAIKNAHNDEEREEINKFYYSQTIPIIENLLTNVFSKVESSKKEYVFDLLKNFLSSFHFDEAKYHNLWIQSWIIFTRFFIKTFSTISEREKTIIEELIIERIEESAIDYSMASREILSLGKCGPVLLKVFIKHHKGNIKKENIYKLIGICKKFKFALKSDNDSIQLIIDELNNLIGDSEAVEIEDIKEPSLINCSEYLCGEELIQKFPPLVLYILRLDRNHQQFIIEDLLLDLRRWNYTKYLIAELLTRSSTSQIVIKSCYSILDSPCHFKAITVTRNLPLSLLPNELIQRVSLLFNF